MKKLGNAKQGLIFVISAPAGTGKTTLVQMLKEEFNCVVESISCTTRKARPGETNGKDYYFLSQEEFEAKRKAGDFFEYAEVFGNYYGTSREFVLKEQQKGHHVILVIDVQGAMQIKEKIPAVFIFLAPPSLEELKMRLIKRQTESKEAIETRLKIAEHEMEEAEKYDYCIINKDLQTAYDVLRSILIAEEHRVIKKEEA